MSDNEQKAAALVAEAEKKLGGSKGFFSNLFGYGLQFKTIRTYMSIRYVTDARK